MGEPVRDSVTQITTQILKFCSLKTNKKIKPFFFLKKITNTDERFVVSSFLFPTFEKMLTTMVAGKQSTKTEQFGMFLAHFCKRVSILHFVCDGLFS